MSNDCKITQDIYGGGIDDYYNHVQIMLMRVFPGDHEFQTTAFRVNSQYSFVITTQLKIAIQNVSTKRQTMQVFPSSKRASGTLVGGIRLARQHQVRYVITWLKLTRSERDDHSNLLILDLAQNEMLWYEPHGSDLSLKAHPPAIAHYYNSARMIELLHKVLSNVNEEMHEQYTLVTPKDYLPPVWGQSITRDHFCSLWCILFLEQVLQGTEMKYIQHIAAQTVAKLNTYIEAQVLRAPEILNTLMKSNQSGTFQKSNLLK